jgi:hypothetical protein
VELEGDPDFATDVDAASAEGGLVGGSIVGVDRSHEAFVVAHGEGLGEEGAQVLAEPSSSVLRVQEQFDDRRTFDAPTAAGFGSDDACPDALNQYVVEQSPLSELSEVFFVFAASMSGVLRMGLDMCLMNCAIAAVKSVLVRGRVERLGRGRRARKSPMMPTTWRSSPWVSGHAPIGSAVVRRMKPGRNGWNELVARATRAARSFGVRGRSLADTPTNGRFGSLPRYRGPARTCAPSGSGSQRSRYDSGGSPDCGAASA